MSSTRIKKPTDSAPIRTPSTSCTHFSVYKNDNAILLKVHYKVTLDIMVVAYSQVENI